ncbi:MAG: hypothetical protein IPL71_17790 [Anaerolineales bacterium]|nr:hypothetical protein [Anaerolineales bacterium]
MKPIHLGKLFNLQMDIPLWPENWYYLGLFTLLENVFCVHFAGIRSLELQ